MGNHRVRDRLFKAIVGVVFFGAFFAGGTYAAYKIGTNLPLAMASSDWPRADGIVTTSRLVRKRKSRKRHRLRYTYRVNGYPYEGTQVAFMGRMFGANPQDRYRRYPQGKRIVVYYNPDDPSASVIEPGVRIAGFVGGFVLVVLFVPLGLWGLRASLKS